jgi:ABC-2 type transport system permease protein
MRIHTLRSHSLLPRLSWLRIRAVLIHSYYHGMHSKETWIDLFWFTSVQFVIFGFLASVLSGHDPVLAQGLLLGFFFWEIVRIGQYCITVSVLWEVWSHSLSNMFTTPLTMNEMMVGQVIAGVIKTTLVMIVLGAISVLSFHFSLLMFGPLLFVYAFLLLAFSFAAGLFLTGLILRFGTDMQSLAWGLIYIFQPLSAVFYPVSVLPIQVRWLAYVSPITYVMEAARSQLQSGVIKWDYIGYSLLLTVGYALVSQWYLQKMFRWSRQTGAFASRQPAFSRSEPKLILA